MKTYIIIGAYIEDGKALSDLLGVYTDKDKAEGILAGYLKDEAKFPAYDNITLTMDFIA